MGLFDRFRSAGSGETHAREELAELAGRVEALEDRLRRHAAMCRYPQMQSEAEKLADHQAQHLKTLKAVLAKRSGWPRPPAPVAHEGSNDWGRLSGDLNVIATLGDDMHRTAIKFEPLDEAIATTMRKIAEEDSEYEARLRKIALKCDPQALD
jgi:hypothetical protein